MNTVNLGADKIECGFKIEDGGIGTIVSQIYAEFTFSINNQKPFTLSAQGDTGNCWVFYNGKGDGESIKETIETFFEQKLQTNFDKKRLEDFLKMLLKESEKEASIYRESLYE